MLVTHLQVFIHRPCSEKSVNYADIMAMHLICRSGFSLWAFKQGLHGLPMWSKGSLLMIQGFVVLKRLKLLPKY